MVNPKHYVTDTQTSLASKNYWTPLTDLVEEPEYTTETKDNYQTNEKDQNDNKEHIQQMTAEFVSL